MRKTGRPQSSRFIGATQPSSGSQQMIMGNAKLENGHQTTSPCTFKRRGEAEGDSASPLRQLHSSRG